jgi:hypothetical protein
MSLILWRSVIVVLLVPLHDKPKLEKFSLEKLKIIWKNLAKFGKNWQNLEELQKIYVRR